MDMSAPFKEQGYFNINCQELGEPLEESEILCRGCLAKSGEMKNVFEWGLVEDFFECTNVQIERIDGVSELLCTACEEALLASKKFRVQCQNSDVVLKNTVAKHKSAMQPEFPHGVSHENKISSVFSDNKLILMITAPNMEEKILLPCPFCEAQYIKQKDLKIHLVRTHQQQESISIDLQFYCSIKDCCHSIDYSANKKYFKGRKYLNQHTIKVHMERTYQCSTCTMSFPTEIKYKAHFKNCNTHFVCQICNETYKCNERLLVHLKRRHPDEHRQYKDQKEAAKSGVKKPPSASASKKFKPDNEKCNEYVCDSPKRSSATQTRPEDNIKNDVSLASWLKKSDNFETKTDEISTQTVFEDLLSLKSQNSEDDSLFETVSLSDIQTQTFPIEFGLSRSNKETITDQSPDLSIKETQTCFCLYDSPKVNYKLFESVSSSPSSLNLISSETQTSEIKSTVKSDVLLSFNSAETQTSFDEVKSGF